MAQEPARKRRKFADMGHKVELHIAPEKACQVDDAEFNDWADKVQKIYDNAGKEVADETRKLLKDNELGIHAPMEPTNWRKLHIENAELGSKMSDK